MNYLSIGDIQHSRFWCSIEFRRRSGWSASIGRTYVGTRTGLVLSLGWLIVVAHIRTKDNENISSHKKL